MRFEGKRYIASACLLVWALACGPGHTAQGRTGQASNAREVEENEEASANDSARAEASPGSWAPEGSLANVEDIPVEGRVEVRESLSVGERIVLTVPIAPEGNALLEMTALPEEERERVILAIRRVQQDSTFAGCTELMLELDGEPYPLEEPVPSAGPTALGRAEAVRGLVALSNVARLAQSDRIEVQACGQRFFVPTPARAQVAEFLRLFAEHDSAVD